MDFPLVPPNVPFNTACGVQPFGAELAIAVDKQQPALRCNDTNPSTNESKHVGVLLGWRVDGRLKGWIASWRFGRFVGGQTGRSLVGKEVGGLRGLQLLATTVSPPSSSSVRMLKGLLL